MSQDLHIHTIFSTGDSAVVPEQTIALIAQAGHTKIAGISDHLEYLEDDVFLEYKQTIIKNGLHVGTEVNSHKWVTRALELDVEYYIYHCQNVSQDYLGTEQLLSSGKPLIIAHPLMMGTDLNKLAPECLIEINNRYVWRSNWRLKLEKYLNRFRFVLGSDAHQPHWLNQNIARYVANSLEIKETILFNS